MSENRFVRYYVVILSFFAIMFALIVPAFQVPDEIQHYWRAYELALDQCFPPPAFNAPSSYVRDTKVFHQWIERDLALSNGKLAAAEIQLLSEAKGAGLEAVDFHGLDNYPCTLYAPQAAAINVVSLFGGGLLISLYLSRLMAAFASVFILYQGIRRMPFGKPLYAFLSLLPMVLQQIGSVSADALTIALAFFGVSTFLRYTFRNRQRRLTSNDLLGLFTLAIALGMGKLDAIIVLLGLAIPTARFGSIGRRAGIVGLLFIASVATNVLFIHANHQSSQTAVLNAGNSIDASENLRVIVSNPSIVAREMVTTVNSEWAILCQQTIGIFGWLSIYMPKELVALAWAMIAFLSLATRSKFKFDFAGRLTYMGVGVGTMVATAFILLIGQLPSDALLAIASGKSVPIQGLQGRYFLTSLLPIALAFGYPKRHSEHLIRIIALIGAIALAIIALFLIVEAFYI